MQRFKFLPSRPRQGLPEGSPHAFRIVPPRQEAGNGSSPAAVTPWGWCSHAGIDQEFPEDFYDARDLETDCRDEGRYVQMRETRETFWANEYLALALELRKPHTAGGTGWLCFVGECENCKTFFVKKRSDQRAHNARCRMRAANRKAYRASNAQRRGHR